jgi:hypothetical protein
MEQSTHSRKKKARDTDFPQTLQEAILYLRILKLAQPLWRNCAGLKV